MQLNKLLIQHNIVADSISKLSDQGIGSLPNLQNLKQTVQRIRQKHQNPYPLPTNRDSFSIDPLFTKTNRDHTFLQFDSGPIDQRMLIFSTNKFGNLGFSSECYVYFKKRKVRFTLCLLLCSFKYIFYLFLALI